MDIAEAKIQELIEYFRFLDAGSGNRGVGSDEDDGGSAHLFEDGTGGGGGTEAQIRGVIEGLDVDEQADLVALVWIGRGDFEPGQWPAALRRAHERHLRSTAAYLMGIPNVGDLLEEGLAAVRTDA